MTRINSLIPSHWLLLILLAFNLTLAQADNPTEDWTDASREALQNIASTLESWDTIAALIAHADRGSKRGTTTTEDVLEEAALERIPDVQRNRIKDIVMNLLVDAENDMTSDEKGFWWEFYNLLDDPDSSVEEVADLLATIWGDPHIITGDGYSYDFQAAGEFTGLISADGKLEIQIRLEPVSDYVSMTTALAFNINGDRLSWYIKPRPRLLLNGAILQTQGQFTLDNGGQVFTEDNRYQLLWPEGHRALITVNRINITLRFEPAGQQLTSLQGLLGNFNGNPEDDLQIRNGKTLTVPNLATRDFQQSLYGAFSDSWRVTEENSLFSYSADESVDSFRIPGFPAKVISIKDLEAETGITALRVCQAAGVSGAAYLNGCILDVALTGNQDFANEAVLAAAPAPEMPTRLIGPANPGQNVDPCSVLSDCETCNKQSGCGFCDTTGRCQNNSERSQCVGTWRGSVSQCKSCDYNDCKPCATDGFCSWQPSLGCVNDSLVDGALRNQLITNPNGCPN